ncbi:MAG: hypothetical protein J5I50_05605 [Chitinophagaceae bacterium]|nr:hypothetical protein [Chitinophagaceae bacterium]
MVKKKYVASVREINDQAHYVIKKYSYFPEFPEVPEVLDSMGMHQDFLKACSLAGVEDEQVIDDLMAALGLRKESGKVVRIYYVNHDAKQKSASIFRFPQSWLSKLKWAHA